MSWQEFNPWVLVANTWTDVAREAALLARQARSSAKEGASPQELSKHALELSQHARELSNHLSDAIDRQTAVLLPAEILKGLRNAPSAGKSGSRINLHDANNDLSSSALANAESAAHTSHHEPEAAIDSHLIAQDKHLQAAYAAKQSAVRGVQGMGHEAYVYRHRLAIPLLKAVQKVHTEAAAAHKRAIQAHSASL